MTEIALIPPVPHLRDFNTTGTCMLLAHLCKQPDYVKYYRERRMLGDYLILDNSAFELGASLSSMPMLMALGSYLQAQEIVAPDSIMDQHGTYGRSLEAVTWMASHVGQHAWRQAGSPRIMVVPQVDPSHETSDDYGEHAELLMKLWHDGAPYLRGHITLGVSKNMDRLFGGWMLLFHEIVRDLIRGFPIEVHCLGAPKSLTRIKKVIQRESYIRSLDTALPFVCAVHGVELSEANDNELPKRPDNYLDAVLVDNVDCARRNVTYMIEVLKPERTAV